jgi:hypothetical protein
MSEGFLANNAQERNLSSTFSDWLRKTPAIGVLQAGTVLVSTRKDSFDLGGVVAGKIRRLDVYGQ